MANQKTLTVGGNTYVFDFVNYILPERDQNGKIIEYSPQDKYKKCDSVSLNKHGHGSFCKFSVKNAEAKPGVYLQVLEKPVEENNEHIIYIGEAVDLKKRFSSNGYGGISPKNCFEGGQSTNCKMNKVVLEESKKGNIISLYFYATTEHKKVEKELLLNIQTKYNVKDN